MSSQQIAYFKNLNKLLQSQGRAIPFLIIDLDILDHNISQLRKYVSLDKTYRVVVKSLPSYDLLRYIMDGTDTRSLMVFHQPFLTDLARQLAHDADILVGKPMPIKTAEYFYKTLPILEQGFDPYGGIQWLVDTKDRLLQYVELARSLGKKLRINLEIDVGLHRGGFATIASLCQALDLCVGHASDIEFSGLMGYDPHVVKLPSILRSQEKAFRLSVDFYQKCKDVIRQKYPVLWHENLCFNGAGSPTVTLHDSVGSPLNDVSAGSCLVMPTTFDMPTLNDFRPACFIATPILKTMEKTSLPGLENLAGAMKILSAKKPKSCFIYGGFWRADYIYPKGLEENKLYGASTNQTMLNAPRGTNLHVDDFVFLRPQQSEFVFLQFGDLIPYRDGAILEAWPTLRNV